MTERWEKPASQADTDDLSFKLMEIDNSTRQLEEGQAELVNRVRAMSEQMRHVHDSIWILKWIFVGVVALVSYAISK